MIYTGQPRTVERVLLSKVKNLCVQWKKYIDVSSAINNIRFYKEWKTKKKFGFLPIKNERIKGLSDYEGQKIFGWGQVLNEVETEDSNKQSVLVFTSL